MNNQRTSNKIVVLSPYFGKLPVNVNYTFLSMSQNSFIDWVIITDDDCSGYEFENIRFVKMSYSEIKEKTKSLFDVELTSAYKLCDYKPLYGKFFSQYIQNYEFWGYCDLDMIFGDLAAFLTDDLLSEYDKFFDLGHFSLYRNTPEINNAFSRIEENGYSLSELLSSSSIYVLDESYNNHISINELIEQAGYKVYRNRQCFADVITKYRNLYVVSQPHIKYAFFMFSDGKLTMKSLYDDFESEYIYVHFQKRKFLEYQSVDSSFFLCPKGFYNKIDKKCFFGFPDFKLIWYIKTTIKRKIKSFKKIR